MVTDAPGAIGVVGAGDAGAKVKDGWKERVLLPGCWGCHGWALEGGIGE